MSSKSKESKKANDLKASLLYAVENTPLHKVRVMLAQSFDGAKFRY